MTRYACARMRDEGDTDAAAGVLDYARRLALSQECVPVWAFPLSPSSTSSTSAAAAATAFAAAWRAACDRVEELLVIEMHHGGAVQA